ncbi:MULTISPECIES: hypothetical protein [Corynebacterium]|uniref:Tat pathway signal sequence domain protein n=1 Tax=Corynebacterium lipophiloflavum (strain ATCC 700352 / DSM 44291 / CCUG 37336 / JCM 10383 / DMMZ 1944) TaxID=525263 RepID=C0XPM1_CORLD|nr:MULTISPECIES: hypothetical protein [Corynebacterium]EEI17839.1 Tat pathway signal sequence domain protein [Corynebacterium lipophiloflavum DSM 44291]MCT1585789.1 hypothetical protein [Corynebacterium sanguinis]MCT2023526.1 hypothetical protein [Corynebacterium sanguinis]
MKRRLITAAAAAALALATATQSAVALSGQPSSTGSSVLDASSLPWAGSSLSSDISP